VKLIKELRALKGKPIGKKLLNVSEKKGLFS